MHSNSHHRSANIWLLHLLNLVKRARFYSLLCYRLILQCRRNLKSDFYNQNFHLFNSDINTSATFQGTCMSQLITACKEIEIPVWKLNYSVTITLMKNPLSKSSKRKKQCLDGQDRLSACSTCVLQPPSLQV